ncbi:MAG: hypothetical protein IJY08_03890 [Clostridia bacterium]|nr:hypothetical protein [Clostridia bacterium]
MKKIFCKKAVSAFLAAVMVIAMIPMGMISVFAEGYSTSGNTVTITSAAGWNEVAANASTYAAYDIILGNNIDFSETDTDSSLFGATTFSGTFDGKGYTISNFNGAVAGMIANCASGEVSVSDVIIKDSTISSSVADSCTKARITSGTLFAEVSGNNKIYFSNIVVNNGTVENHAGTMGGLIGTMNCTAGINVDNCTFTGLMFNNGESDGSYMMGGIVGESRYTYTGYTSTSVIRNCYVNAVMSNRNKNGRAAGIAGLWGKDNNSSEGASLIVENCYLTGSYTVYKGGTRNTSAGIVSECQPKNASVTFKNVIADAMLDQVVVGTNKDTGTWGIYDLSNADNTLLKNTSGYLVSKSNVNTEFTVENCYSSVVTEVVAVNNHTVTATTGVTGTSADKLVATDEKGFITGVCGNLAAPSKVQAANAVAGSYVIRFVAPVLKDVENVAITVVVKDASGNQVTSFTKDECTKYDKLTGHSSVAGFTEYLPSNYGAQYFAAVAIEGVPTGAAYTYEVTATVKIDSAITVTSTTYVCNCDANGALANN